MTILRHQHSVNRQTSTIFNLLDDDLIVEVHEYYAEDVFEIDGQAQ